MTITTTDIKIKIKFLNHPHILAQATVILFDIWETHGWKILKSKKMHDVFQEELWIQAPCYRSTNSEGKLVWKEIVFINNRRLYDQVQEKIYDTYCMARSKKEGLEEVEGKNQFKDDIDLDEIEESLTN